MLKKILYISILFAIMVLSGLHLKVLYSADKIKISLPEPKITGNISLQKTLNDFRSIRSFDKTPLSLNDISQMLWAAAGEKVVDTVTCASKTYPSAGAIYPLDFYLIAGAVQGLIPGIYKYSSKEHELLLLKTGDFREEIADALYKPRIVPNAPAVIIITADYDRTVRFYKKPGYKYVNMDIGHSGQNIYLMSAARKLATVGIAAIKDSGQIKNIVGFSQEETPVYIFPIGNKKSFYELQK